MATHICFGIVTNTNDIPALIGSTIHGGQSMAESGTSAASTAAADEVSGHSNGRLVCRVKVAVSGVAIYAKTGPNPSVTVANGIRLDPGDVEYIKCNVGDKVAIITA